MEGVKVQPLCRRIVRSCAITVWSVIVCYEGDMDVMCLKLLPFSVRTSKNIDNPLSIKQDMSTRVFHHNPKQMFTCELLTKSKR
jgi:hypothetical protein